MRQTLKRLTKMVAGYGAVQWAGPLLSFIFTPIITRILNPSDYGIADYVLTIASAIGTLAVFALPQAIAAHFNDQLEETWQRRLTGSALVLAWLIAFPIGLLLVIYAPLIAQWAFHNPAHTVLFQLTGASVMFSVSSSILTTAAQAALRVRWGMLFSLATILGTVAGNVLFIILLRLGATGMVLTPILTSAIVSLLALVVMRNMIGRPTWAIMKTLAASGAILLPMGISGWVLMVADRLFLVQYVSTEALGHYAIANKIASLLYVAMLPLYSAWTSLALSIQHDPDAKRRYAIMARYLIAAVLGGGLVLGLFATEILIVMTRPSYLPAAPYVGFLAYVQVFTGYGTVLYTSAMASKQFKAITWTVGVGAIINMALNFALIPTYGIWGATIATVIGYAVPQALLYPIVQKHYPVPYPVGKLLSALLIQCSLLIAGLFVPPCPFLIRVILKGLIFALLPIAFVAIGLITRFELEQAILFVRLRWARLKP